ncbi:unnamed protein product [Zymoseptoria tritici ST99CH_1A5]|uniref:Manganese lipoxygenase n=3 Tax=Zymoseptoria tritici TaxID=1047171 RepID=A0A1X7RDW9_ZYMT9|nr:unnamed protein product [Zymoseptoria tritici ST99CH_3D7]SMR41961.1 unnamed protein product [Zymoseptoria tritici ST99CH_1E4]SMR44150.1 unnamed protein product [Zymoseptoria tritici ST99CH_3D1]SMY19306.1 unnamed protein product [Zymoseptoria tritici ST99CH_1A5]
MMFNVNDLFMSQFDHFARTHYVAEAIGLAARRKLSEQHPLSGLSNRVLYATYGLRPLGYDALLAPGEAIDSWFGLSAKAAEIYANTTYFNGFSGAVQANYFYANLRRRGLIDSPCPSLKQYPFFEDAALIYDAVRAFTGTYCESYYDPADSDALDDDPELQAWMTEAIAAQVIDFPTPSTLRNVSDLADLMAHIGFIVSVAHHTLNTNDLLTGSGVFQFHTSALWQPVPEQKGVYDVVPYLPKVDAALATIDLYARCLRPKFVGTNRTLLHMFEGEELLRRSNTAVRAANEAFLKSMSALILGPDVIPFNVAI